MYPVGDIPAVQLETKKINSLHNVAYRLCTSCTCKNKTNKQFRYISLNIGYIKTVYFTCIHPVI